MTKISDLEQVLDDRLQRQSTARKQIEVESLQRLGSALSEQSKDVLATWRSAMDQHMKALAKSALMHHERTLKMFMAGTRKGLSRHTEKVLQGRIKELTHQNQLLRRETRQLRLYLGLSLGVALAAAVALLGLIFR